MKKGILTKFLLVASVATLGGCAGSTGTPNLPSIYRGSYTGTWNCPSLSITDQTLTMTVQADGSVTGTMNRGAETGTLGGVINATGHVTATDSFVANGNYVIGGVANATGGHLIGSLSISYLGTEYLATFDVTGA